MWMIYKFIMIVTVQHDDVMFSILDALEGDGELRDAAEFSIRKYTRYANLHVDYAYSCLGEQDLNGKHYLAKHWGENYEIMNRIVTTDSCKKVLMHAKQDVNAARAKRTPEINMVLMCRNGRHRSIAISRILRACLDHAECKNGKNVNLSIHDRQD